MRGFFVFMLTILSENIKNLQTNFNTQNVKLQGNLDDNGFSFI